MLLLGTLTIFDDIQFNEFSFSVLNKYPEAKKIFNVPETTKANAELLGTQEVQTASNNLLNHYIDIVKNANGDLNTAAQSKAEELKKLGVKAEYIQVGFFIAFEKKKNSVLFLCRLMVKISCETV